MEISQDHKKELGKLAHRLGKEDFESIYQGNYSGQPIKLNSSELEILKGGFNIFYEAGKKAGEAWNELKDWWNG